MGRECPRVIDMLKSNLNRIESEHYTECKEGKQQLKSNLNRIERPAAVFNPPAVSG